MIDFIHIFWFSVIVIGLYVANAITFRNRKVDRFLLIIFVLGLLWEIVLDAMILILTHISLAKIA